MVNEFIPTLLPTFWKLWCPVREGYVQLWGVWLFPECITSHMIILGREQTPPGRQTHLNTYLSSPSPSVNERAVRMLLECILVFLVLIYRVTYVILSITEEMVASQKGGLPCPFVTLKHYQAKGVLIFLKFYWALHIVEFVLGRFSHFNIAFSAIRAHPLHWPRGELCGANLVLYSWLARGQMTKGRPWHSPKYGSGRGRHIWPDVTEYLAPWKSWPGP